MSTLTAIKYGFLGDNRAPRWAFSFHWCHVWIGPALIALFVFA